MRFWPPIVAANASCSIRNGCDFSTAHELSPRLRPAAEGHPAARLQRLPPLPQLIETRDFFRIGVHTINGACARNQGMALFPQRIGGHYAMCSRIDGENLFIMYSDSRMTAPDPRLVPQEYSKSVPARVQPALGLRRSAPAARPLVLAGLHWPRAGLAADARIVLVVQRIVGHAFAYNPLPDVFFVQQAKGLIFTSPNFLSHLTIGVSARVGL